MTDRADGTVSDVNLGSVLEGVFHRNDYSTSKLFPFSARGLRQFEDVVECVSRIFCERAGTDPSKFSHVRSDLQDFSNVIHELPYVGACLAADPE